MDDCACWLVDVDATTRVEAAEADCPWLLETDAETVLVNVAAVDWACALLTPPDAANAESTLCACEDATVADTAPESTAVVPCACEDAVDAARLDATVATTDCPWLEAPLEVTARSSEFETDCPWEPADASATARPVVALCDCACELETLQVTSPVAVAATDWPCDELAEEETELLVVAPPTNGRVFSAVPAGRFDFDVAV